MSEVDESGKHDISDITTDGATPSSSTKRVRAPSARRALGRVAAPREQPARKVERSKERAQARAKATEAKNAFAEKRCLDEELNKAE